MVWPQHPSLLIPGWNDTWNDYQRLCKGRVATSVEWKRAKEALHQEFQAFLEHGGLPSRPDDERCR